MRSLKREEESYKGTQSSRGVGPISLIYMETCPYIFVKRKRKQFLRCCFSARRKTTPRYLKSFLQQGTKTPL